MLTATILWLALGTTGNTSADEPKWSDEPTETRLKPMSAKATNSAVAFDALPPLPQITDDARVKRFLGALTGGVVGLGASLALMPLGDSVGCFGGPCVSFVHGLLGTFAPLLALGGAWLGFEIMGGDGGLLTPSVALGPAILIALALLGVAEQMDAQSSLAMMPYLIASGMFLAGGAALALDLRARHLNSLGGARTWAMAPPGRVAITALVTALTSVGTGLLTALLVTSGFGFGGGAIGPVLGVLAAATGTVGVAAAAWGVHRAMNGRGSFLSALVGLGLGWLVTIGGIGLFAISQGGFTGFSPVRNTAGTVLVVELGIASAVIAPVLALEWSHSNAVEESLPTFSFSAAPTSQGGMVSAGMRF
jgi:hypothetical protein